jgi:uncharacterized repeat protein (TIGR01451 family)
MNWGKLGFTVKLKADDKITCIITNKQLPAKWSLTKSSDPVSGTTVLPGQQISYTLNVRQNGGVAPASLTLTDDMSRVLDNATLVGTPTPSQGTATLSGTDLVWTITDFSQPLSLTYTVRVNDGAYGIHLVNVLTLPPGGTCECEGGCTTDHPTPHWTLSKTADPASGSTVQPGQQITYTLSAHNDSDGQVIGATATDDLAEVLDHAALSGAMPPGLVLIGDHVVWSIPDLAPGVTATVSFPVTIDATAAGVIIHNIVTPGPGGTCGCPEDGQSAKDACETTHRVPGVNLSIVKTHSAADGGAGGVVDSGKGDLIDYELTVGNKGSDAATGVKVSDPLPAGVTFVDGSFTDPAGWSATVAGGTLTITYSGTLEAGDSVVLHFQALVGTLTRSGNDAPYPDIDNSACVTSTEPDSDTSDNCSTDTTKVKAIAVTAQALCVRNAPVVSYSITPYNLTAAPTIALIWWTPDGFAAHNPNIPAADQAALLADGAQQVNYVSLPSGWMNGQTISGTQLWPGAGVDANGQGNAWPGWRQLDDGTWVLDPAAPFYDLRTGAVIEVRINPTTADTVAYPPPSTHCDPSVTTTAGGSAVLAKTGSDVTAPFIGGALIVGLGMGFMLWARRRRPDAR